MALLDEEKLFSHLWSTGFFTIGLNNSTVFHAETPENMADTQGFERNRRGSQFESLRPKFYPANFSSSRRESLVERAWPFGSEVVAAPGPAMMFSPLMTCISSSEARFSRETHTCG